MEIAANPITHLQIEGIDHELFEGNREQFFNEDPILAGELFRVKEWRKWMIANYQSHGSRVGPEIEKDELFSLSWLEANDIAEDLLLSTINHSLFRQSSSQVIKFKR